MKIIGITGAHGLIGRHLHALLHAVPDICVECADRDTFRSPGRLDAFVRRCDTVVHLAGMNRGDEREVAETNVALADAVIAACERTNSRPQIIFSSSTHIFRGTPYGDSKRECSRLFAAWAERNGTEFANIILPNVFGEGGRPFYNSVVSTFCHLLATGGSPEIHADSEMALMHAQQVASLIHEAIRERRNGDIQPSGRLLNVSGLLQKLQDMDRLYRDHVIPDLRDPFDLALFNTYRSYLYPDHYPVPLKLHSDPRGSLFEAVKSLNGGQTFFSSTKPGITRGNHYHLTKVERFLVAAGQAEINIRPLFSPQVWSVRVTGDEPAYVDIPTLATHNLVNTGDTELLALFWANEIFDPSTPDTFREVV